VQAGGGFVRLDKATGKVIWRVMADGGGMNGSAFSSPFFTTLGGVPQILVQGREELAGMRSGAFYSDFQSKAEKVKDDFLSFLIEARRDGKKVAAYGAAAKGNTLLNFAGVRPDLLPFVVDKNPSKQGKFMPGSRIPIVDEARLHSEKPDYVVLLPWNLYSELSTQLDYIRQWGAKFVTAVPSLLVR
jgi:hypothetical protein